MAAQQIMLLKRDFPEATLRIATELSHKCHSDIHDSPFVKTDEDGQVCKADTQQVAPDSK